MNFKSIYKTQKRFINKISDSPLYLIFFVTSKCNANCSHCFYWNRDINQTGLKLNEIEKIAKSTKSLSFLLLTGGEPFLREDISEIAELFYIYSSVRNFAIPTNGSLPDEVLRSTESILLRCPDARLTVNISLDGIGELHDNIRGVHGLFTKSIESYKKLISLKKKYSNLDVGIITTISKLNQDNIKQIHDYVIKELKTPIWAPFLIRSNPRNPDILDVDPEKYKIADTLLKIDIRDSIYKGYTGYLFARFNSAKNVLRREIITDLLYKNKNADMKCFAGRLNAVLYPDGSLYACEMFDSKIGNIKDYDFNMNKIWLSVKASDIRKNISKAKCSCTHECFLTTNILYNLKYYPKLIKWWYKLL